MSDFLQHETHWPCITVPPSQTISALGSTPEDSAHHTVYTAIRLQHGSTSFLPTFCISFSSAVSSCRNNTNSLNASRVSLNYNIVPVCLIFSPTMSRMVSIWPRLQDSGIALGHAKPHLEISHSQVLLICFIPYPLDWPASFNHFIRPFLIGRVVIDGAAEELPMTF